MGLTTSLNLYATDLTIPANSTYSTESIDYDVSDVDAVAIQIRATGDNAASSGAVRVKIVAMVHDNYSTEIYATYSVNLDVNNPVVSQPFILDVRGVRFIKVREIINSDPTYSVSGVNVSVGKTIV